MSTCVPPLREIHFTNPGDDQTQLQQAVQIDRDRGHTSKSLTRQPTRNSSRRTSNWRDVPPQPEPLISVLPLVSGIYLLLLDPPINVAALKPPSAADRECGQVLAFVPSNRQSFGQPLAIGPFPAALESRRAWTDHSGKGIKEDARNGRYLPVEVSLPGGLLGVGTVYPRPPDIPLQGRDHAEPPAPQCPPFRDV